MEAPTVKRGVYPLHGFKLGLYRLPILLEDPIELQSVHDGLKKAFEMDMYADRIFATYRWKEQKSIEEATALELENPGSSLTFLQEHFAMYREAPQYMCGSNEVAELLLDVPARFNRLVFYSGDVPHSAHIPQPELLSADFSKGRLTLNCFTSVRYS